MKELINKILKIAFTLLVGIMLFFLCIVTGCIFFSPNVNTSIKGLMFGIIFYIETIKGE